MTGTVICFVLAQPRPERRTEACRRYLRARLRQVPFLRSTIAPRWSPARRLGYGAGLRAAVQSLRRRHARLPPVIVLMPAQDPTPIAAVDDVVPIDTAAYAAAPALSSYFGPEIFYKLEVFRLARYRRVIYLDCDTLVLGDISPLWDPTRFQQQDLYAVRETGDMGGHALAEGTFNTGVMLLNRPILGDTTHRRLLDLASRGLSRDGGDQGVLHRYLQERPETRVGELEAAYNVLVSAKTRGRWDRFRDDIRVLHFVNRFKPWTSFHRHDWLFDVDLKRLWDAEFAFRPGATAGEGPCGPGVANPAGR